MPMNLKEEIIAGESYSLEFKRVPNEEREKYLNIYRVAANTPADNPADNEGNHKHNRAPNGTNSGTNQIIECVCENPSVSIDELAERIGVSRRTTVRMIDRLKKQGRIRRKGGTRGVWEVL